jgi:hypothetical protein
VPEDAKPAFKKSKATAAVARKVGVSTRTFERGKKILEKASEEDKQKLREGKTSIAKVYREVVAPEKEAEQAVPVAAEALISDARREQNEMELSVILRKLLEKELFCPSCGHAMLECSKCHKTLQDMLKQKAEDKTSQSKSRLS